MKITIEIETRGYEPTDADQVAGLATVVLAMAEEDLQRQLTKGVYPKFRVSGETDYRPEAGLKDTAEYSILIDRKL